MAGKKSEKRKYSHSQQLLDKRLGLLLMVPIAAVIFGITGIPFIRALYLSFTNKVVGVPEQFIGFDNYLALFGDKIYWKSLYNTIIYTVAVSYTHLPPLRPYRLLNAASRIYAMYKEQSEKRIVI